MWSDVVPDVRMCSLMWHTNNTVAEHEREVSMYAEISWVTASMVVLG